MCVCVHVCVHVCVCVCMCVCLVGTVFLSFGVITHMLLLTGHRECINALVGSGADVNAKDKKASSCGLLV